jgi:hypothetical protein
VAFKFYEPEKKEGRKPKKEKKKGTKYNILNCLLSIT